MFAVDEPIPDYLQTNMANWNSRVPFHEQGYGLGRFRDDPTHISDVVRFDLPRLGSVQGLDGVHLQCHIGTDTLSLAPEMVADEMGEFRLRDRPERLAASYTLRAVKDTSATLTA